MVGAPGLLTSLEREGGYFERLLIQIVHFDESNSGGVVHTTYYRSVATRRQIRDDCRVKGVADPPFGVQVQGRYLCEARD